MTLKNANLGSPPSNLKDFYSLKRKRVTQMFETIYFTFIEVCVILLATFLNLGVEKNEISCFRVYWHHSACKYVTDFSRDQERTARSPVFTITGRKITVCAIQNNGYTLRVLLKGQSIVVPNTCICVPGAILRFT